jgi:hypothetical protein
MSDQELKAQFFRCKQWQDPEQWDILAVQYCARGYFLNAAYCFGQADAYRAQHAVTVETLQFVTEER